MQAHFKTFDPSILYLLSSLCLLYYTVKKQKGCAVLQSLYKLVLNIYREKHSKAEFHGFGFYSIKVFIETEGTILKFWSFFGKLICFGVELSQDVVERKPFKGLEMLVESLS
jgi:hypothetical protein